MFDAIKVFIGRYFLHKNLYPSSPLHFNNFIKNSKTFLVIFSDLDEHYNYCLQIVDYLTSINKDVTVICKSKLSNLSGNLKIINYDNQALNWYKLPTKEFIDKIKGNYDVSIDLNLEDNIFSSYIITMLKTKFRVGFKNKYSDIYYNFIVEKEKNNTEISYKNLLNSLRVF